MRKSSIGISSRPGGEIVTMIVTLSTQPSNLTSCFPEYCLLQKRPKNIPINSPKYVFDIEWAPEIALLADVILDLVVDCPDVGGEAAAVRGAVVALPALVLAIQFVLFLGLFDLQQGCQMAKYDPILSLDCAREQSKERKGSNFAA